MTSEVLRTKLFVPRLPAGLIRRERLCAQLDAGLWAAAAGGGMEFARSLTLIAAPAGFGKTTLAVEWLSDRGVSSTPPYHLAWLSLDESDSAVLRFLSCLVAALQHAAPDVRLDAAADLLKTGVRAPGGVLTLLLNDMASAPRPVVLVLDDYHTLHGEAVHGLVAQLLERLPPSLHLVIVSRVDPDLPLSRLRVRGQMMEIRASDLRLSEEEAGRFLEGAIGAHLAPDWIAALDRRTEGWIAGLKLAALSLRGRDDVGAFVQAFGGDHHYVVDYLVDEVLRQQPPAVRRFLVQTSILDRLCGPLCDAVLRDEVEPPDALISREPSPDLPRSDSQAMLEKLERANLFLVPLDERRGWYRYHALFADALQVELGQAERQMLHRRAARWHLAEGLISQSVRHALAGKDYALAADLLGGDEGREAVLWADGDFEGYCRWVGELPAVMLDERPSLELAYARALQLSGHLARAEEILARLAARPRDSSGRSARFHATVAMHRAHCLLESGKPYEAHTLALLAMQMLADGSPQDRMRAAHCLADTSYGVGDLVAALPLFEETSATPLSRAAALNAAECAARTLALQGRLEAAEARCGAILGGAIPGEAYSSLMAGVYVTLGEVYYQQNRLELIPSVLHQGIQLANRGSPRSPVRAHAVWAFLQYARLAQVHGDNSAVAGYLREADELARDIDNTFYLQLAVLRQRAMSVAAECDLPALARVRACMPVAYRSLADYEMWIVVHAALADGHLEQAKDLLSSEIQEAERQGRGQSLAELQLWYAIIQRRLGEHAQAQRTLHRVLERCAPEENVRIILDAGPTARDLLAATRSAGRVPFAARVLSAWTGTEAPGSPGAMPARAGNANLGQPILLEPLTAREVEILQLLAAGLSNQEVGRRLYIGVGTVKWYLTGLYQKLAVRSRTQAVARARELALIT